MKRSVNAMGTASLLVCYRLAAPIARPAAYCRAVIRSPDLLQCANVLPQPDGKLLAVAFAAG